MPFKTRGRKIRAGKHRITITREGTASYSSESEIKLDSKSVTRTEESRVSNMTLEKYSYVKGEIVKILLLSLLIIGLQVIVKFSSLISFAEYFRFK